VARISSTCTSVPRYPGYRGLSLGSYEGLSTCIPWYRYPRYRYCTDTCGTGTVSWHPPCLRQVVLKLRPYYITVGPIPWSCLGALSVRMLHRFETILITDTTRGFAAAATLVCRSIFGQVHFWTGPFLDISGSIVTPVWPGTSPRWFYRLVRVSNQAPRLSIPCYMTTRLKDDLQMLVVWSWHDAIWNGTVLSSSGKTSARHCETIRL